MLSNIHSLLQLDDDHHRVVCRCVCGESFSINLSNPSWWYRLALTSSSGNGKGFFLKAKLAGTVKSYSVVGCICMCGGYAQFGNRSEIIESNVPTETLVWVSVIQPNVLGKYQDLKCHEKTNFFLTNGSKTKSLVLCFTEQLCSSPSDFRAQAGSYGTIWFFR